MTTSSGDGQVSSLGVNSTAPAKTRAVAFTNWDSRRLRTERMIISRPLPLWLACAAAAAAQIVKVLPRQPNVGQQIGTESRELMIGSTVIALFAPTVDKSKHFHLLRGDGDHLERETVELPTCLWGHHI